MVIQTRRYTVDEFEEFISQPENRDRLFELINGEIVEKECTEEHGVIAGIIGTAFVTYKRQHKIKGHPGVSVCHHVPDDQENVYLPDVSFRLTNEPPVEEGAVPTMPDVAVEIQSPGDSLKALREKADYYLQHGSRMVLLVLMKRLVEVYTPDDVVILTEEDIIDGGDVLPGFKLPVKEIFDLD